MAVLTPPPVRDSFFGNQDSVIKSTAWITWFTALKTALDGTSLHVPATVSGAPLTISTQELTFNYNTTTLGVTGNNLYVKNDGHTHATQYLELDGANANTTINIGAEDLTTTGALTGGSITSNGFIDWAAGNVIYVPLAGDIQTYVNAATAGDTLILASGQYVITSTITVDKQLNIVGQGFTGFLTSPVTAGHGTLISSTTAAVTALNITSDNARIANLSINLTGAGSTAIATAKDLQGVVFTLIDVIVDCAGAAVGFTTYSSDVVMRDLTFYVKSSDSTASGVFIYNTSVSTRDSIVDCFNVTGTSEGTAGYSYAFACWNNNSANTLTLNLSNSVCKSLNGTTTGVAVASYSTTTNNSIVNAYLCTFDGKDYDAYQTGTNELNLGGSVLVNNLVFGTVTYRATMAAANAVLGGALTLASGSITDTSGAIDFGDEDLSTTGDITGGNLSGTNTGNETTTTAGALINGATNKTPPVDADYVGLMDSAASNILKKLSWANIKATLKTYFDTLYATLVSYVVPVGVIIAWHKSFANTPALPDGWVECNGQTLSDGDSPYDGQVIPNLNGAAAGADLNNGDNLAKGGGVFLKAKETSGETQFDSLQGHFHHIRYNTTNWAGEAKDTWSATFGGFACGTGTKAVDISVGDPKTDGVNGTPRTATITRPRNMTVVMIMKIK